MIDFNKMMKRANDFGFSLYTYQGNNYEDVLRLTDPETGYSIEHRFFDDEIVLNGESIVHYQFEKMMSELIAKTRTQVNASPLPKIIAVDFDGCLFENKYPYIGAPIRKNIDKLKAEQANGAKAILWTNRVDQYLIDAVEACSNQGICFDAINENLHEVIQAFGGDPRKIFSNEYWDDHAIPMSIQDIGEFSDGYHSFNDLYEQRLYLSAALFNTFKEKAWKSTRHSDGKPCFDGEYFIVGIDTPEGPYTYHYEMAHWALFDVAILNCAPEWDGHTDKDVGRLMSLIK